MGDASVLGSEKDQGASDAFEVVVAHFNEDLTWLMPLAPEATLYVKGEIPDVAPHFRQILKLPNIGRESHTFLYHIVSRYHTLSGTTLFVQGSKDGPACHRSHSAMAIEEMKSHALKTKVGEMTTFGSTAHGTLRPFDQWNGFDWVNDADNTLWLSQQKGDFLSADCTPARFWRDTFGYDHPPSIMFAEGAFFAVRAETVRMRKLEFYERLLGKFEQANHVNPEIGHFVEKFWGEMFTGIEKENSM